MAEAMTDEQTGFLDETLRRLVGMLAPVPRSGVVPSDTLIGGLGYDSLSLMELAFNVEDLFGLDSISMERSVAIKTVADLTAFVTDEIAEGRGTMPDSEALAEKFGEAGGY